MNINAILTSFWSKVKSYLSTNYLGKTAKAESAKSADSVAWGNVSGKPTSYTPASHTHSEYLTSITKSMVTTALGYTPPTQDTNTWIALKGSTTSAAGTAGYAPAPAAGAATRYLRCDGTWQVPPDTNTWTKMTAATADAAGTAGYVPSPAAGRQAYMLRGNATWTEPGACIINNIAASKNAGITSTSHAVGTVCLCFCNKGLAVGYGKTVSGAYLFPVGFYCKGYNGHTVDADTHISFNVRWDSPATASNSLGSGTWKYMGNSSGTSDGPIGLFVRVS